MKFQLKVEDESQKRTSGWEKIKIRVRFKSNKQQSTHSCESNAVGILFLEPLKFYMKENNDSMHLLEKCCK